MYQYNPYQSYNQQQVVKVNGENGARAYQMGPNSSVLLLDEQNPIVWLKTTDGAGYPQLTPYKIEPFVQEPEPDIRNIESRIKRLEELLNESNSTENE